MIDLDDNGNIIFAPRTRNLPTVTIRPVFHERNRGKRVGYRPNSPRSEQERTGDPGRGFEDDPRDWADVRSHRSATRSPTWSSVRVSTGIRIARGISIITWATGSSLSIHLVFNQTVTDVETCYKMMTRRVARVAAADRQRFRHRSGDERGDCASARSADLRDRYKLFRPHLYAECKKLEGGFERRFGTFSSFRFR